MFLITFLILNHCCILFCFFFLSSVFNKYISKCIISLFFLPLGAPTISVEPVDTVVDAGTTVVLNCQAEGEPTPKIEWSRQGRPLQALDRFSSLSNGSLRVSSAQKEDTAEYECVARNLLGSVLVRVTLTVRGEPHIAVNQLFCN